MIQRRQTVFLLVAFVLTVVCMCLPIADFVSAGMEANMRMTNLWIKNGNGNMSFQSWPLFSVLLFSCLLNIFTIFKFHNRPFQARLCTINIILMLLWCACYVYFVFLGGAGIESTTKTLPLLSSVIPVVNIVFYVLARVGIKSDERLVRAADRIR